MESLGLGVKVVPPLNLTGNPQFIRSLIKIISFCFSTIVGQGLYFIIKGAITHSPPIMFVIQSSLPTLKATVKIRLKKCFRFQDKEFMNSALEKVMKLHNLNLRS